MRRPLIAVFLFATVLLSAAAVRPYTLQFTDASSSAQVRWPALTIRVALSSSLNAPQPNIKAGSDVAGAARRALSRWAEAANIRFVVTASDVQSVSAPGTRGDGVSLITVAHTAENAAPFAGAGGEMAGRTRVFSTVAGSITEADIVLNPGQLFSADGTPGTYDLEATILHEVGHLLGLEHSAVLGATMQPRQAKNGIYNLSAQPPRTLSEDDRAGARAIYGARLGSGLRGAISGTVTFSSGAPVFGANVWAEEAATGRVAASNITLLNGAYRIEGLAPGSYRVLAQSLSGAISAAEISSQRGAYAGLALGQQLAFRAEELGTVKVKPNATATLNAQLSGSAALLNPSLVGVGGQLSTVAVQLARSSRAYRVFVAGPGVTVGQLARNGVASTSPFVVVDQASLRAEDFGPELAVVSFDVYVTPEARAGDYSLRLQSQTGEVAYVVGGLTVDAPEQSADAFVETDAAPADAALNLAADEFASGG
ncbi:MAG TPA: matrixin family metalloprotease [Pyrinomonadaceae bacterium]|nr:matrixin family metalloprotease [Pyrinomonadaceae bacterium]